MSKTENKKTIKKNISVKQKSSGIFYVGLFAVLILTFFVFNRSITKIFIGLDDPVYISDNPFTTLFYAIEFKFFGRDASLYHIVSLLLHLLNIVLVYKLIEKLNQKKWFAIIGAMIFAIHPMHIESVVWISEQKEVLYSFFYLAGLITYIKYLQERKIKYLFITHFLFLFSLFSKSAAVTFPLILVLCDFYFKRKWNKQSILEKISFLLLSLLFGILSILSQNTAGAINDVTMISFSAIQRIFIVCYAISYYIFKFIFPIDLCVLHYAPKIIPPYFYLCPLFLLLITWFVWRSKTRKRVLIFGWLFYILSVILVLQIIPVGYVLVSERYSYLSYIGLIFMSGNIFIQFYESNISATNFILRYRKYLLFIFIFIYSYLSFDYIKKWQSNIILFTDIVKKIRNPDMPLIHTLKFKFLMVIRLRH